MAEIISLAKVIQEQEDRDNGVFAIREDDGELKNLEDWSGEEWEELVDGVFANMANRYGVTKWDIFADFMCSVLQE